MDCSMPGIPVLHHLPEFAQTHVHWVDDAIQPSHPLSSSTFSSCPQSIPASESFLMSRLFTSDGQSIGASASASVFSMNIQGWFPVGLTGLILLSKGLSRVFSSVTSLKRSVLWHSAVTSVHNYWKNHSFGYTDFCHCSVTQLCLTLWNPMDCSTPGFPVLHHLLELAQTHVHWVSNVIQPSHLLLPSSPFAFDLCQHQGLF